MTEPVKTLAPEIYAKEAEYMKNMREHSEAFDAIVDAVPADRQDIRDALQGIYHVEPGLLIDRDKMARFKEQNPSLSTEVNTFLIDFLSKTAHREWLRKVNGKVIKEIQDAKAMPGLEDVPLDSLIVSDIANGWENIKQLIIPLDITSSDDVSAKLASRRLRMLRAQINSQDGFLVLIKDEQLGKENKWALSIINPRDLKSSEKQLREGMEVCYMTGQVALGSSTRAALLAVTGKSSI